MRVSVTTSPGQAPPAFAKARAHHLLAVDVPAAASGGRTPLLVEPNVLEAPAFINAVDHDRHAFDIGLHAGGAARMKHDGPRPVLLQPPVDLPNQFPALFLVGHYRLLDEL